MISLLPSYVLHCRFFLWLTAAIVKKMERKNKKKTEHLRYVCEHYHELIFHIYLSECEYYHKLGCHVVPPLILIFILNDCI